MAKDKTFLAACRAQGATESTIAAAATTDLGAQNTPIIVVSGNTGITSFGSKANVMRTVRLTGVPLITNSANLVTGTDANIQGAPGDIFEAYSDNSGKWYITRYAPFGGIVNSPVPTSVSVPVNPAATSIALNSINLTPGKWKIRGVAQIYGSQTNSFGVIKISTTNGGAAGISQQLGYPGYAWFAVDGTSSTGFSSVEAVITISSNTTYYLNAATRANTDTWYGSLQAERIY